MPQVVNGFILHVPSGDVQDSTSIFLAGSKGWNPFQNFMFSNKTNKKALLLFISIILIIAAHSSAQSSNSSFERFTVGDSIAPAAIDTAAIAKKAVNADLKIVKRSINYDEQITLAVGMLAFVAIILTTTQAWNPN